MISPQEPSLDSQEFINDPEKYFREVLAPRLEEALKLKFDEKDIKSFMAPVTVPEGESL